MQRQCLKLMHNVRVVHPAMNPRRHLTTSLVRRMQQRQSLVFGFGFGASSHRQQERRANGKTSGAVLHIHSYILAGYVPPALASRPPAKASSSRLRHVKSIYMELWQIGARVPGTGVCSCKEARVVGNRCAEQRISHTIPSPD